MSRLTRRAAIGASLAMVACRDRAISRSTVDAPPLRSVAPFPVGAEITADMIDDPAARQLLLANFNQITPGLEFKMERVLHDDGTLDFSGADRLMAFARVEGLRVHGHNLVWYIYRPPSFLQLANDKAAFARAYRDYIHAVAGRHPGRISGWDVVNEPISEDGEGYRDSLWSETLGGPDYIVRALEHAQEADPQAVLFVNEYHLESKPRKLATFLRLIEDLLRRGAPLTGIGTQMHMVHEQPPASIAPMMRELAAFGLPIHVSELDVSTYGGRLPTESMEVRLERQARLVAEAAAAFTDLPVPQRYAFTTYGLRDKDSWLRLASQGGHPSDSPLLFDDEGRAKPAAAAFARAVSDRSPHPPSP